MAEVAAVTAPENEAVAKVVGVIFALPSKLTPPMVLAVANVVASVDKATAIFAEPSKEVPPIVLAVVNVAAEVAVDALPVNEPVIAPVTPSVPPTVVLPVKIDAPVTAKVVSTDTALIVVPVKSRTSPLTISLIAGVPDESTIKGNLSAIFVILRCLYFQLYPQPQEFHWLFLCLC